MTSEFQAGSQPPAARWFRWAIAFVWLSTGILVLHPAYRAIGSVYLDQLGLPTWLMYVTCVAEIVLGLYVALRPADNWVTWIQITLIAGFTCVLAVCDPWLLANPFGVLTKNLPLVALIVTTWLLERECWTRRTEWLLRTGMAVIWITEGLVPKILFQQSLELDVVGRVNPLPLDAGSLLVILGVGQVLSGIAALALRGRWLSVVLAIQLVALVVLPILVSLALPLLCVHPFGPLSKNVPIFTGTLVIFLRNTPFLSAVWSNLLLVTYAVPKGLLEPRLPAGVELDTWNGRVFVSLVSLDFKRTRVLGIPWPGFRNFPDVNLRFYARCGERRGVVFIREFVPLRIVAWLARTVYHEPFESARIATTVSESNEQILVERVLEFAGQAHRIRVEAARPACGAPEESEAHFFKKRYWGFGENRRGDMMDFRVEHPVWDVYPVRSWQIDLDWSKVYGQEWAVLEGREPDSVILAAGSPVRVWLTV